MSNVTKFRTKPPKPTEPNTWLEGRARCLACGHHWEAAAPVGAYQLECPLCSCPKGAFMSFAFPENGYFWKCVCRNDVFAVVKTGIVCVVCGVHTNYKDLCDG